MAYWCVHSHFGIKFNRNVKFILHAEANFKQMHIKIMIRKHYVWWYATCSNLVHTVFQFCRKGTLFASLGRDKYELGFKHLL